GRYHRRERERESSGWRAAVRACGQRFREARRASPRKATKPCRWQQSGQAIPRIVPFVRCKKVSVIKAGKRSSPAMAPDAQKMGEVCNREGITDEICWQSRQ